jgi:hypothetical protein
MSKMNQSRRDLLKALGALPLSVPVANLVQVLLAGAVQKAYAQTTGVTGNKYLYVNNAGAPPRWTFDLFLTPYDTANFVPHPHVATVGVADAAGNYSSMKYATRLITVGGKSINAPPLWASSVPTPSGTMAPLSNLLANMLNVRGINVGIDGHPQATQLSYQPSGATYTLMGLVADSATGTPLKALRSNVGDFRFASATGITPNNVAGSGSGKIDSLLDPFSGGTATANTSFRTKRDGVKAEIQAAVASLDSFAESQHPGAKLIKNSRIDAEQMMARSASELRPLWTTIYAKYDSLIKTAFPQIQVAGLTDKPVGANPRPDSATTMAYRLGDGVFHATPLDMRDSIQASTTISDLAANFTLAELSLVQGLSNSITIGAGGVSNLLMNGANTSMGHDQHTAGTMASTLYSTKMFGVLATCLLELVTVLKAKGLFNSTVIHVGGEFGRIPNANQDGSDHGWMASSAMILSGMVQGPMVIGNITKTETSTRSMGTWGRAAPSVAGRVMDYGDLANALAIMLKVPQVVKRADSIIALQNGVVVSNIGLGQQV